MKIICLGDSLTYGYGVRRPYTWIALSRKQLEKQIQDIEIINKGINGDTTSGMLARLESDVLRERPDLLFFMGGSNDIFWTRTLDVAKNNVSAIVSRCLFENIPIVIGIPFPVYRCGLADEWKSYVDSPEIEGLLDEWRNWLLDFTSGLQIPVIDFQNCFEEKDGLTLQDMYLDGIHPKVEIHKRIARNFTEYVTKM